MASVDANLCSLSAEVRSYLFWTIEWPVMNVAADQDSTSNDSVQPFPDLRRSEGSCAACAVLRPPELNLRCRPDTGH
jgi:hypothetical protein